MNNGLSYAGLVMSIAILISVLIIILYAHPEENFINKHPSPQILGLSFQFLIGFMLFAEATHLWGTVILGREVGSIPKGYHYFGIAFSLGVEFVNMKLRKRNKVL